MPGNYKAARVASRGRTARRGGIEVLNSARRPCELPCRAWGALCAFETHPQGATTMDWAALQGLAVGAGRAQPEHEAPHLEASSPRSGWVAMTPESPEMSGHADADASWSDQQGVEDEPWKWDVCGDVDDDKLFHGDTITPPNAEPQHGPVEAAALQNYEAFHKLARGAATLDQVFQSSASVIDWAAQPILDGAAAPRSVPDESAQPWLLLPLPLDLPAAQTPTARALDKCGAMYALPAPIMQGAQGRTHHQLEATQAHHGDHRAHHKDSENCPSPVPAARHPTDANAQEMANASEQLPKGTCLDAESPSTPPISSRPAKTDALPTSQDGRPKPAPAWIAGALYYIASQERFAKLTGITLSEEGSGAEKSVHFRLENLRQNGKPIASMLREIMRLAGSEVNLPGWDAVRKHLSGQSSWWKNPCRGGNRNGDFAQVYVECRPGSFKQRKEALLRSRPGLVERAMQNWMDAWAHGTLDNLASLPPEDPPGPATRKRVRKNHLQLDGEQTAIKKCKECDATSAQHLLPRKQQASNVSNAPEAASATAFTSIFAPQLV